MITDNKQLRNYFRVHRVLYNRAMLEDNSLQVLLMPSLQDFLAGGGLKLMDSKGFDSFLKAARSYYEILK